MVLDSLRTWDVITPILAHPNRPGEPTAVSPDGLPGARKEGKKDADLAKLTAKVSEEIYHACVINVIIVAKQKKINNNNKIQK